MLDALQFRVGELVQTHPGALADPVRMFDPLHAVWHSWNGGFSFRKDTPTYAPRSVGSCQAWHVSHALLAPANILWFAGFRYPAFRWGEESFAIS